MEKDYLATVHGELVTLYSTSFQIWTKTSCSFCLDRVAITASERV